MEEKTVLFGIPIPSADPTFLTVVAIHILIALSAVVSGFLAMINDKSSPQHSFFGKIYFWCMMFAFATVVMLSVMRWPHNIHLLSIGVAAFLLAFTGRTLARKKISRWPRFHTMCMGASYILLLTGFYVDNGRNLPFWRLFPQWFFWVFPAIVGVPIIVYVVRKHPLNRGGEGV